MSDTNQAKAEEFGETWCKWIGHAVSCPVERGESCACARDLRVKAFVASLKALLDEKDKERDACGQILYEIRLPAVSGVPVGERRICDLARDAKARIRELEQERDAWKGAIIDAAVVGWTYTKEQENDPRLAVNALLAWESKIALDPAVSSEAAKLHDRVRELEAEVERLKGTLQSIAYCEKGSRIGTMAKVALERSEPPTREGSAATPENTPVLPVADPHVCVARIAFCSICGHSPELPAPESTPAPRTWRARAADVLADACEVEVKAGRIDARSAIGDALLDYRDERPADEGGDLSESEGPAQGEGESTPAPSPAHKDNCIGNWLATEGMCDCGAEPPVAVSAATPPEKAR